MKIDIETQEDPLFERYKTLRAKGMVLNIEVVESIPTPALKKAGKELGILRGQTLIFESDDESSVLMDYCIHSQRVGKQSLLDRFVARSSYPEESDEAKLLRAWQESHYAIMHVQQIGEDHRVVGADLLTDNHFTLMDVGLAISLRPKDAVAARVFAMPDSDLYMTTGTPIPLRKQAHMLGMVDIIEKYIPSIARGGLSRTQEISLQKKVLRYALRNSLFGQARFLDVNG